MDDNNTVNTVHDVLVCFGSLFFAVPHEHWSEQYTPEVLQGHPRILVDAFLEHVFLHLQNSFCIKEFGTVHYLYANQLVKSHEIMNE